MNGTGRFFALIFLCCSFPGIALDFGLAISQTGEYANTAGDGTEADMNYTGSYSPWFSSELGETAKLYLSAKLSMVYETGEWKPADPPVLGELGRSEFSWRPGSHLYLEAGRIRFQDPAGIIAAGLFDGLGGSVGLGKVRLSAGAFYTGFLYKESAEIVMTSGDMKKYAVPLDYTDLGSYFASRRVLVSAGAEFPDLTPRTTLALNVLAQFDVNPASPAGDSSLHTQYLTVRYTFLPLEPLALTGTAVMGLAETPGEDVYAHFAAGAGVDWEVPGALRDMLQGEIRWSSGAVNKNVRAFAPVTNIAQGQVFTPKLSGLMTVKGKYTARPHRNFSVSAEGTYFIRTDGETLAGTEYPSSASRLLGGEAYGTLLWVPVSDLAVTMGGGAFFPGAGDVFVSNAPIRWKLTAGIMLSL